MLKSVNVDGEPVSAADSYTFENVTGAHTLTAVFEPKYTVTTIANNGINVTGAYEKYICSECQGTDHDCEMINIYVKSKDVIVARSHIAGCTNPDFSTNCCRNTFSLTPKPGYTIEQLIINEEEQTLTAAQKSGMIYTFTEPTETQTLEVLAEPQLYTITVTQGSNGTITADDNAIVSNKVTVRADRPQTFTITPNEGYILSTLKIDGVTVPNCTKYTFADISANHTIAATYTAKTMTFTKATTLTEGKEYIICSGTTALAHNSSNSIVASTVTVSSNTISTTDSTLIWDYSSSKFSYLSGSTTCYLYPSSSTWSTSTSSSYTFAYTSSKLKGGSYYLRYYSSAWRGTTSSSSASTITLYVKTDQTTSGTKVTFNPNGGSGGMADQEFTTSAQNLSTNQFTKQGYTFAGWSTTPYGSVVYTNGQSVQISADTTLYAIWTKN